MIEQVLHIRTKAFILMTALSLFITPSLLAQSTNEASLRVGLREAPPFAHQDDSGQWQGIAVDLWDEIAAKAELEFEYTPFELADLLAALEDGSIDVGVAALTISTDRETRFDFTQPFMQSGLVIAAEATKAGWWGTVKRFVSLPFLQAAGALSAVILLFGFLIWVFERKKNEQFGGKTAKGIGAGFWWSAVTMTTVGYGDKAPVTFGGRIVGLVWMFAGIIIISSFTAAIASSLTVGSLQTGIETLDDLRGERVGVIESSSGAAFLDDEKIDYRRYASAAELVDALAEGRVSAVVHDAPFLRYELKQRDLPHIRILAQTLDSQNYAFGLPSGSPLTESINRALLQTIHSDDWSGMLSTYLGE